MGKREERGVPIELFYWSQIVQLLDDTESEYMTLRHSYMDLSNDKDSEDPSLYERVALREFDKAFAISKIAHQIYKIFYPEGNINE